MAARINPFHELYVGESIGPDKFVNLFSNVIVEHALALFQPGNVILKGLPGTGKSMLLNLLKPSVRLAYAKSNQAFPIPKEFGKFIGAGINLKRSGISDFGQRPIDNTQDSLVTSPIYFGDFLNYWVVTDILASLNKLVNEDESKSIAKEIGIHLAETKLNKFACEFAKLDCWHGYLSEIKNYQDFKDRINHRITAYRDFLNYNLPALPEEIKNSKTLIGEPISKCVGLLRDYDIIGKDVEVYIRIDQYEELAWLDDSIFNIGTTYQQVIHKLLGMRDASVSYRIGTRHFAWTGDKIMYGTTARLEKKRNFTEISIDDVLRRPENRRTWVFPKFADDIFTRRITMSSYKYDSIKDLPNYVFGKSMLPNELALRYVPNNQEKALRFDDDWPDQWCDFLKGLSKEDPLSARLGEAWARQKGKRNIINNIPKNRPYPWDGKWWRKERIEQALMQIASRNQQQLFWFGKDDIMGLSGGNILIFLSLCQHIWDVWMRDNRNRYVENNMDLPHFDYVIQTAGVRETSSDWYNDISDEKGGKERKLFINYVGTYFYNKLINDKAMSNPGHNGFSLTVKDWERNAKIAKFLNDATDYGDLYDGPHTSKLKEKEPRHKWYLNPILSPHFKIPYSHTKEPVYVNFKTLNDWFLESLALNEEELHQVVKKKRSVVTDESQSTLQFPPNN
jgi:hypothetical protein